MEQLWQDSHDSKVRHETWDMTSAITMDKITPTDQSGQVSLIGQPGAQAGQVREDEMPGNDNKDQTLGTGEL
jgi:hypothetical protein